MKIFFTLTFFLFNCAIAFAQSDIEQEVRNLPDMPSDVITKARRLLKTEFINGNLLKVKALKDFLLDSLSNDTVIGLSQQEQILLHYWTSDFSKILYRIEVPYPAARRSENRGEYYGCLVPEPYPSRESILYVLMEKSQKYSDTLFSIIETSSFPQEEKDFLKLHLHSTLFRSQFGFGFYYSSSGESPNSTNQLADEFLAQYPNSKYESYVRNYIRYVWKKAPSATVFDFSAGAGIYNSELAENFRSGFVTAIGAEYNYKDMGFFGLLSIVDRDTKKEMSIDNISVPKGITFQLAHIEIGVGYSVFENSFFKITPTGRIGFANISPHPNSIKEYPELKGVTIGTNIAYTLGVTTDYKLGGESSDTYYWPLRFRYGYTVLDFKNSGMSGGMHAITLGIGMYVGGTERDY